MCVFALHKSRVFKSEFWNSSDYSGLCGDKARLATISDTKVHEVIELSNDTGNDSWNEEDGDRMECLEHEEEMEVREVTMVKDVLLQAKVWKHLPSELHANILQFFSVPELCRLQVVCRAWNDLTHKLDFALRVRSKDMYLFKAPHAIDINVGSDSMRNWTDEDKNQKITDVLRSSSKLFEPSTRTSYPISMECLYDGMRSRLNLLDECRIMAVDRGFVWVLWSRDLGLMQVANLVTKSVVEIPPLDKSAVEIPPLGRAELSFHSSFQYVAGAIIVAENYSSFTLDVLFTIENWERPHMVRVDSHVVLFDSQVGKWLQISMPTGNLKPSHMVKLNDTLYTLCWDLDRSKYHQVFALDTVSDTWSQIGVGLKLPNHVPQLATTLGQLFIIGLSKDGDEDDLSESNSEGDLIGILEIDIVSRKSSNITTFHKASIGEALEGLDCINDEMAPHVVVVGYGDFILMTSIIGQSIAYNLLSDDLDVWSFSSIANLKSRHDWDELDYGVFARATTLTLNLVSVP